MLARSRFEAHSSAGRAERYVAALAAAAEALVDPENPEPGLTRDPDDDYLVALARASAVDYLISGDADLTSLEDARPPVLTPRQMADRLDAERSRG